MPEDILLESVPEHVIAWLQAAAAENGVSLTEALADVLRRELDLPPEYNFGAMKLEIIPR